MIAQNNIWDNQTFHGRGAQINPQNRFFKQERVMEHIEVIDEPMLLDDKTEYLQTFPKTIINKVDSPDLMNLSLNPYQGCEHGCVYCYARNTHEFWGYSAGLDFERKVIVKMNAAELLEKELSNPRHKAEPMMFSGNTDCYQPIERKLQLTRKMLEVLLKYRHPAAMITKNSLICRDIDILADMAKKNLVHVMISITGMDEDVRMKLEPRTSTYKNRFETLRMLSEAGIRTGILFGPVIPGLNSHEIPEVLETARANGARSAGYTMVRLNGQVGDIFRDWLRKSYPDKAEKILHHIEGAHGGKVNDTRWGTRMTGEGQMAESIAKLFKLTASRLGLNQDTMRWNTQDFNPKAGAAQLTLF